MNIERIRVTGQNTDSLGVYATDEEASDWRDYLKGRLWDQYPTAAVIVSEFEDMRFEIDSGDGWEANSLEAEELRAFVDQCWNDFC